MSEKNKEHKEKSLEITLQRYNLLTEHLELVVKWEKLKRNPNKTQEESEQKNILSCQLEQLFNQYIQEEKISVETHKYWISQYRKLEQELKEKYNHISTFDYRSWEIGNCAEQIAFYKLQCKGHSPVFLPKNWPHYDLVAYFNGEWKQVQVKSINRNKRGTRLKTNGGTTIHYPILICVDKQGNTFLLQDIYQSRIIIGKHTHRKLWAEDISINMDIIKKNI